MITKSKKVLNPPKGRSDVDVDKVCAEVRSKCNKLTDEQRSVLNEKARDLFHGVRSKVALPDRR